MRTCENNAASGDSGGRIKRRPADGPRPENKVSLKSIVEAQSRFCGRNPVKVLLAAAILSVLAGIAVAHLPILTARQALLPKNEDVSKRFERFLKTFGAASDLIVVLEGGTPAENERYALALAERLRLLPEVGSVTEHLDIRFFLEHAYLLIPEERLAQFASVMDLLEGMQVAEETSLDESLRAALDWVENHPPLSKIAIDIPTAQGGLEILHFLLDEWRRWLDAPEAPAALAWEKLLVRYGAEGMAKGFFASRDGRMLFVFVHPRDPSEEFESLRPFIEGVRRAAAALDDETRRSGRTPPRVALTGLPAIVFEEYVSLRGDIVMVVFTAAALIVLLVVLAYRSLRWGICIFLPMLLGVLWSTGLTLFLEGHLTIITFAFTAILFGLGADYGIFTTSRIAEERRRGAPLIDAIAAGMAAAFRAVLTAGGAAVVIFGALGTVSFTGFAELGRVAAVGVLMVLVSTYAVGPALYALLPPRIRGGEKAEAEPPAASVSPEGRRAAPRWPAAAAVALGIGAAVLGTWAARGIVFDYDVLSLLPRDSEAAEFQRRMVAESDYQGEVVIFLAPSMEEARRIANEAARLPSIARVQSLTNLFPPNASTLAEKARPIGASIARAAYARKTMAMQRVSLAPEAFSKLVGLIARGQTLIDEAEEQAFSAGHGELVQVIDRVRARIQRVLESVRRDPEKARQRSELFFQTLLSMTQEGFRVIEKWQQAEPLTPQALPASLRDRFFTQDGKQIVVYAFPSESVYDPDALDRLMKDVYRVSPEATGFPTTHQVFSRAVVESFTHGTYLALVACLVWILLVLRSLKLFLVAALPMLLGGGWLLGLMVAGGFKYTYANIIALPLVMGLAVDYGVWYAHRLSEFPGLDAWQVMRRSAATIVMAAGTVLSGLGAIALARYRGVSGMGFALTVGLLCCLVAALGLAPAAARLLFRRKS